MYPPVYNVLRMSAMAEWELRSHSAMTAAGNQKLT